MAQYTIREIATLLKIDDEPPPTEAEVIVQDASTDGNVLAAKACGISSINKQHKLLQGTQ